MSPPVPMMLYQTPGAVLLVAHQGRIVFFKATGKRSLAPAGGSMHVETIFDLASLTKPLATALAMMKCVDTGTIDLDQPIDSLLPYPVLKEKQGITPRFILAHCAGFADWMPFYLKIVKHRPEKRKEILRKWIMELPLVYPPGKETQYSDLGFIILEWIIEQCTGELLHGFLEQHFFSPLSLKRTFLGTDSRPAGLEENQFAATEKCPWRNQTMCGVVHDENAYALGGYSGHAGLFGTTGEVYRLAHLLRSHLQGEQQDCLRPETVDTFFKRQDIVKNSTWAMGWDTPTPGDSSSGRHFSVQSVGHLGYTGTSVWWDLQQDVIVVFLSNRVQFGRENKKIKGFRPILHDRIMEEFVLDG